MTAIDLTTRHIPAASHTLYVEAKATFDSIPHLPFSLNRR